MSAPGPLLAIDTATRQATLALSDDQGRLIAERRWQAGHRHSESLLDELARLLTEAGLARDGLGGIVAGIGPGSFTGLRVGLATAKTLAYGLGRPIVGVATLAALARGAVAGGASDGAPPTTLRLLLPAGPNDRYLGRYRVEGAAVTALDEPRLVPPDEVVPDDEAQGQLVAADFDATAAGISPAARALGERALAGLGAALLALGARRLAAGESDDVAQLVPVYVTLPRGLPPAAQGMAWSPDLH